MSLRTPIATFHRCLRALKTMPAYEVRSLELRKRTMLSRSSATLGQAVITPVRMRAQGSKPAFSKVLREAILAALQRAAGLRPAS